MNPRTKRFLAFASLALGMFIYAFSLLAIWDAADKAYWYNGDYIWDLPFHITQTDFWTYMDFLLLVNALGVMLGLIGAWFISKDRYIEQR